jgi:uracil-DNA glycosylase
MALIEKLTQHVRALHACDRCPKMHKPVVSGPAVSSSLFLVGQAPGIKEPLMGRPFAWTAGKTMFRWFEESWGVDEAMFRKNVYMAAVCRCYPGKNPKGGDRVPDEVEINKCAQWMEAEFQLLKPRLVLAVGKLAINQFMLCGKLDGVVGKLTSVERFGHRFDLIALPHPSGASTWHRMEPGKTLLRQALGLVRKHPAFQETFQAHRF